MADSTNRHGTWRRLRVGAAVMAALCGTGAFMAAPAHAGTGAGSRADAVFSDGNFDTPVVTPGTFIEPGLGQHIGSWRVAMGNVDLTGAGFWQTVGGDQSVDLDGDEPGGISQTFNTFPLVTYDVSFALAGNVDGGPMIKTGQVLIDGHVAANFSFDITGKSHANMGYVTKEFTFRATRGSTTLEFDSTTPGAYGPVIDNVTVRSCLLPIACLRY
jgi:choice-of-anchor C domain-containing protein